MYAFRQKEHWLGWLKGYKGAGYYKRKNWHRSAKFVYNHLHSSGMLLWLAEASGVPRANLIKAKQAVLSAKAHPPTQSAAIRRVIPWEVVEGCLDKRGGHPIATATKASTKQGLA
jgi:hypothetical protein